MQIIRVVPLVRLPRQLGFFDYTAPSELTPSLTIGAIVQIPFQKRIVYGVVWEFLPTTDETTPLKEIISIPPHALPVTTTQRALTIFVSTRYAVSLATALLHVVSPIMKRAPRPDNAAASTAPSWLSEIIKTHTTPLPPDTQNILAHYTALTQKISLYDQIIKTPGQHLFICPTIRDTDDLASYFRSQGCTVGVLHSEHAPGQTARIHTAIRNEEISVIIATRIGVFTEIPALKTIVIDQSERPEHKQFDQNPRYDAREIAAFRAKTTTCLLIFASSAPRLEDWQAVKNGVFSLLSLSDTASESAITLINLKDEIHYGNYSFISTALQDAIRQSLTEGKSAFLFLNRKGASAVVCKACDEIFTCAPCSWPQRYFPSRRALICPLCHASTPLPDRCPHCGGQEYRSQGLGTEKIILHLRTIFPDQTIVSLEQAAEKATIPTSWDRVVIVGTSYAAINHPELFTHISTLGVITADPVQSMENARSTETQWQSIATLLSHAPSNSTVIIQAFEPEHAFVQSIAQRDYASFASALLAEREQFHLPPAYQIITLYRPPRHFSQRSTSHADIIATLDKTSILYNNITIKQGDRGAPDRIMIQLPHSTPPPGSPHTPAITAWLSSLPHDWLVDPDPLVF